MIPESLRKQFEKLLGQPLKKTQSVSGGSINRAAKITAENGDTFFLKWNDSAASDMFPKEEKGLSLLQSVKSGLQIPKVIGSGSTSEGTDFLVMEYIQKGSAHAHSAIEFGQRLAQLHKNTADQYGLDHDNYIGKLPQSNSRHDSWIDFFVGERLEPQLKMAIADGKLAKSINQNFERLYKKLPEMLTDESPALLHGDLWGGNYFYDSTGKPVIYDPAVYYGNREIEIAFTHLFGGFSSVFYQAYQEILPIAPGFDVRKNMYNLYPLLVHTNLFGGSYARRVKSTIQQFT